MKKYMISLCCSLLMHAGLYSYTQLQSTWKEQGAPCQFLGTYKFVYDRASDMIYGCSAMAGNASCSVFMWKPAIQYITPLAPAQIRINPKKPYESETQLTQNPLFDTACEHIAFLGNMPIIVKPNEAVLYGIQMFSTDYQYFNRPILAEEKEVFQAQGVDIDQGYIKDVRLEAGVHVFPSHILNNALGQPASRIARLTTRSMGLRNTESNVTQSLVFAAIPNDAGTFNGNGSGIAIAALTQDEREKVIGKQDDGTPIKKNCMVTEWDILDANTGSMQENKAVPLNKTIPALTIGKQPNSLVSVHDMWFDERLNRLYIAVEAYGAADHESGVWGVLVAQNRHQFQVIKTDENKEQAQDGKNHVNSDQKSFDKTIRHQQEISQEAIAQEQSTSDKKQEKSEESTKTELVFRGLTFYPLANDDQVPYGFTGISARGQDAHIAVHKVRTMYTTTRLPYLIVLSSSKQAVGQADQSQSKDVAVYAYPLYQSMYSIVDQHGQVHDEDAVQGVLAQVNLNDNIENIDDRPTGFSRARRFRSAGGQGVLTAVETPSHQATACKVGGTGRLPGPINHIEVDRDTVFASVAIDGNGIQSGIFSSQALFNAQGAIVGWTNWQRASTLTNIEHFAYQPNTGRFIAMQGHKSAGSPVLAKTSWEHEFDISTHCFLSNFVTTTFRGKNSPGVVHVLDVPYNHQSLTQTIGDRLSFNVFTGLQQVSLVETGRDEAGIFKAHAAASRYDTQGDHYFVSNDGTLQGLTQSSRAVTIKGGALDNLGIIKSAHIASTRESNWLLVGGTGGLAVLADAEGRGWSSQEFGLGFTGLRYTMAFKQLGNFSHILRIKSTRDAVYLLMPDKLVRFYISLDSIRASVELKYEIVLDANSFSEDYVTFSDLIISGPLVLLGTSIGLFKTIGDYGLSQPKDLIEWEKVLLPDTIGSTSVLPDQQNESNVTPIGTLTAVTQTGCEEDLMHGGMVYVLNSSLSARQACLYRLAITPIDNNFNVDLIWDTFGKNKKSFYVTLGNSYTGFNTDGSLMLFSKNRSDNIMPYVYALHADYHGARYARDQHTGIIWQYTLSPKLDEQTMLNRPAYAVGPAIKNSALGSWMIYGDFGLRLLK